MKKKPSQEDLNQKVIRAVTKSKQEANSARLSRMEQNRENFDVYHLKQDFSHKAPGQSKEFLAKQAMAVEQLTNFVQQGLADLGDDWYSVENEEGLTDVRITPNHVKKLLSRQLEKADFYGNIADGVKLALLGSLFILKVDTTEVVKPKYVPKSRMVNRKKVKYLTRTKDKVAQLRLNLVLQSDYYPDPAGRRLYEVEHMEMDLHEVKRLIRSEENPDGIYDEDEVERLAGDMVKADEEADKNRLTGQDVAESSYRKRVQIDEFWGTILDENGEVLYENVVCAVANDRYLIRPPEENPFWHKESPYVVSPLIRVPKSVWHKGLMDAPTKHNKAMNEIYNLSLDNGMMAVYGIKQIRVDWLEDASQINDGVKPGMTLQVNSQCPPGAKVIERVDTANMAPEAIQMFQLTNGEFQQSALTNDIRLGVLPQRAVKATEIVAAEQSVTGMLNGLAKQLENSVIKPTLRKSWMVAIQHLSDFDEVEVRRLLGARDAAVLKDMSPAERFAESVNGLTFTVNGLTYTLNKQKDFQRIGIFLQTMASAPALAQAFAEKYSFAKLLNVVMKNLDLDPQKLELDELDRPENRIPNPAEAGGIPTAGGAPNTMSQVPQVGSANTNLNPNPVQSGAQPGAQFPASVIASLRRNQ